MLQITLSDLRSRAGQYIAMVEEEDIFITKNGKLVAKLVSPQKDKVAAALALFNLLPAGTDPDGAKDERFLP